MNARYLPVFMLSIAACSLDPTHTDAVNALGGEAPGVRTGPFHRPGQQCLTCHSKQGPAPEFSVAGTVFRTRGSTTGLQEVRVVLTDAANQTRDTYTNSAGNFYLSPREWTPAFPVRVHLEYGTYDWKSMDTRIGRNGGCAECHQGEGSTTKMPGVYYFETEP